MKKVFWLSLLFNLVCIPLATVYVIRKIQFLSSLDRKELAVTSNLYWKIRNAEFIKLPIDSNSIVFMGDSHTQNFELAEALSNPLVKNRGIIMDGAVSLLNRLDYVVEKHPKKVFIQIGINDLLNGIPPDTVAKNILKSITYIKQHSPNTETFVQSVFPTSWNIYGTNAPVLPLIESLNTQLRAMSTNEDFIYVDIFSSLIARKGLNIKYDCGDSLHLNGEGYLIWTNVIKGLIN